MKLSRYIVNYKAWRGAKGGRGEQEMARGDKCTADTSKPLVFKTDNNLVTVNDFPRVLYSRVFGTSMGFLGVPLAELGTHLIFLCILCQNCVSLTHIYA